MDSMKRPFGRPGFLHDKRLFVFDLKCLCEKAWFEAVMQVALVIWKMESACRK